MTIPTKYTSIATSVGRLVDEKNQAYGSAFDKAGDFLALIYPNGIDPKQYVDMLAIVRIFDKLVRIGTNKDAFAEDPWSDIAGYALLALGRQEEADDTR